MKPFQGKEASPEKSATSVVNYTWESETRNSENDKNSIKRHGFHVGRISFFGLPTKHTERHRKTKLHYSELRNRTNLFINLLISSIRCSSKIFRVFPCVPWAKNMPFSIIINGFPKTAVPVTHIQGPALQGMFLHLITDVDPDTAARLHDDSRYRPYTLSPLGIHQEWKPTPNPSQEGRKPTPGPSQEGNRGFQGFRLPREQVLPAGTPCYLRLTLLEDGLFPTFSRYFLMRAQPEFRLGDTEFTVTDVLATPENENPWSQYLSYAQLIDRALQHRERRIKLHFVTPTTFRKGDVDLPLPLPHLVFQSFQKRFTEFYQVEFLPDFAELVDQYTGISSQKGVRTDTLAAKNTRLTGFIGEVGFEVSSKAPPELLFQMHLLADYAFFCGTGRKTTVGMGQTRRI